MLKMEELTSQSEEQLGILYEEKCQEIFQLRNELRVNRKLERPHELKEKKKDRARIMTALRQRRDTK